jgi:GT2 family glycosyltransferase
MIFGWPMIAHADRNSLSVALPGTSPAISGSGSSQSARVDCAVVVVTFNSARDIVGLLGSLPAAAAGLTLRTVVVDNGSTDATIPLVRGCADVVCVENGANVGYAGGINIGREHAGEYSALLVLNPDLLLEPGAIRQMFTALDEPAVGIVVPMLLNADGHRRRSLRREPTLARAIGEGLLGDHVARRPRWLSEIVRTEADYRYRHPVDWATGAAMLVSAACDRTVGRWDERFFLYSEEVDYCVRARAAGFRVDYQPAARMRHLGAGSGESGALVALMAVNRIRYMEKHSRCSGVYRAAVILHELLRAKDPIHRPALRAVLRRSSWPALLHGPNSLSDMGSYAVAYQEPAEKGR